MNKKIILGMKLAVALGFIVSIAAFFMTFLNLNPVNIESTLCGIDIIKLPDKMDGYSNTFNIVSLFIPNLIPSVEGALIIISKCLIAINIINLLGVIFTLVIKNRKGFIASIGAVIINISISAFVFIRVSNEINNIKDTIGDVLDKFINLIGGDITVTGNIDVAEFIGPGLIIFITAQLIILIFSIIGIILRDKQTIKKTAK